MTKNRLDDESVVLKTFKLKGKETNFSDFMNYSMMIYLMHK